MVYLRVFLIAVALVFFLFVAAPLQWVLARRGSASRDKIPLLFCRSLLRLLRLSVERSGPHFVEGPLLLVVNHVSWLDILVLGSLTPFCFLAKSEVASWPLISAFAKVQGTVFIDRTRKRAIPTANRHMAERMREGRIVLLFPEGTTSGDAMPLDFLSSHFAAARDLLQLDAMQAAVFVQPAALAYSSSLAAWVGDEALIPHLWRVLCGPVLHCRITFGTPIAYTRGSDRKIVARQSRAAIVAMLVQEDAQPIERSCVHEPSPSIEIAG